MKNDDLISSRNSGVRKNKKSSAEKMQHSDYTMKDNSISGMKRALVVIPIVIIGIVIVALIVGINQYTSMYSEVNSAKKQQTSSESKDEKFDESKLLLIISPDNPLPSDYKIDLDSYDGKDMDRSIIEQLDKMMKAADIDGLSLKVSEGYISAEVQHERYMDEVRRLMAREGYGRARAIEEAEKTVPMENHSEFQSGLAVRFVSMKNSDFASSAEFDWLYKNSIKYGFILRYPEGKESSTDFSFDAAHFRYVGVDNAAKMRSLNMTLDEYVSYLNSRR